ncbi:hypothetical protein ABIF65_004256 [Bradyrhizobium japonicum]|jgi:hypothetical protein|uniref:hypothetical protein n=1 Tax=Bradyrhizobium TaxID=374 RepID=UPI0004200B4C|nr:MULTISPECIES: hypothetical protein [Bradyrhizobium]MBR0879813.1 hypothetical protein [Bradyrhizobium liaoningense]MBR0946913.1 hypothetical protein [Bradyrhizobium liaoningense]MBR0999997.1 hypothetical protein [Bradyrhizobium liaoningense]MCP1742571.1 hypothetical protein [Bradyrhizobium japonicum]MCP1780940.1 hypothetical protein [Bradyrhizobium japonicum]
MVRIVDEKTRAEGWVPLFDDDGAALYPELTSELDAIKRERIGGLMLVRDWGRRLPWLTWPKPNNSVLVRTETETDISNWNHWSG